MGVLIGQNLLRNGSAQVVRLSGARFRPGRKGTVSGVMIVTLKDGLILREETYWNIPDLIQQLIGQQAAA
jgi:hypothetical protein